MRLRTRKARKSWSRITSLLVDNRRTSGNKQAQSVGGIRFARFPRGFHGTSKDLHANSAGGSGGRKRIAELQRRECPTAFGLACEASERSFGRTVRGGNNDDGHVFGALLNGLRRVFGVARIVGGALAEEKARTATADDVALPLTVVAQTSGEGSHR